MTDTCCAEATLETVFRPHEALVGALDTLAELGVITIESDIDVTAARLMAALDDQGARVTYEEDTEPEPAPADEVCPFLIPLIKSEHWAAGDTYEFGGVQFTVVRGGK